MTEDSRGSIFRIPRLESELPNHEDTYLLASVNPSIWTLRGFHMQTSPHEETKQINCLAGSLFLALFAPELPKTDPKRVVTHLLRAGDGLSVPVGNGTATAWLTTSENTTVLYQISGSYSRNFAVGYRWDDQEIGVRWPHEPHVISPKDLEWPLLPS